MDTPFVKVMQDQRTPFSHAHGTNLQAHTGPLQQVVSHLAGVQATGPLVEQPIEYFQQVMDTNLAGAVRMTQAVVPAMLARVSPHAGLHSLRRSTHLLKDRDLALVRCPSPHLAAASELSQGNVDKLLRPALAHCRAKSQGLTGLDSGCRGVVWW